ncbi:glycoside hydrolase family 16 protein [Stakelama pacifica]|uniref:Beta-glucanase (GH16 family) n=1 Tax=Stakelama pacifica TaxID=517720 RepID=A0A4R6FII2_9SPHN|nr:glycoside hydrolase family 16 protein [Stakelama pacifica]TDN81202.1 beta-glucanase (GH16 family) [Stakelama pacifica]GGO97055.1 hypothetical protein GCM10011329_25010 [Stakelama pacifica]
MIRQLMVAIAGLASLGVGNAPDTASAPARIDKSAMRLVFEERFAARPDFYDPVSNPTGRWKTNYAFGVQEPKSPKAWETRTLRPNQELQYYGSPADQGKSYAWKPGSLTLVARKGVAPADSQAKSLSYVSGLITTERSFTMRYGYFEARVALPAGKGLWPAFWLLPPFQPGRKVQPQQEVDVFETIGERNLIHATVHTDRNGKKIPNGQELPVDDVTRPHDYGVLVEPSRITWYVDGIAERSVPNKDFHQPTYMLLNLAVGGKWPGAPDAQTHFPARMKIYRVSAYATADSQIATPGR